jgi:hypothetical protein
MEAKGQRPPACQGKPDERGEAQDARSGRMGAITVLRWASFLVALVLMCAALLIALLAANAGNICAPRCDFAEAHRMLVISLAVAAGSVVILCGLGLHRWLIGLSGLCIVLIAVGVLIS